MANDLTIPDLFKLIIRRMWIVAVCAIVVAVISFGFSLTRTKTYEARMELQVDSIQRGRSLSIEQVGGLHNTLATEAFRLKGSVMAERVADEIAAERAASMLKEKPADIKPCLETVDILLDNEIEKSRKKRIAARVLELWLDDPQLDLPAKRYAYLSGLGDSVKYSTLMELVKDRISTDRYIKTRNSILLVKVTGQDRELTIGAANALFEAYRRERRDASMAHAIATRNYIEGQVAKLEKRIKEVESKRRAFRDKYKVYDVERDEIKTKDVLTDLEVSLHMMGLNIYAIEYKIAEAKKNLKTRLSPETREMEIEHEALLLKQSRIRKRIEFEKKRMAHLSGLEEKDQAITREADVLDQLFSWYKNQEQVTRIAISEIVPVVRMVDFKKPIVPSSPNIKLNTMAGLSVGIVIGIIIVIILEIMDTTIGNVEEMEEYIRLPVVGMIPNIDLRANGGGGRWGFLRRTKIPHDARLVTLHRPRSPVTEAYRVLRTNLHFMTAMDSGRVICVTSSGPQEGKSTTLSNLAMVLAQQEKKILLIGANMRCPSLYKIFSIKPEPGLSNVLIGEIAWKDALRDISKDSGNPNLQKQAKILDNIDYLPCGTMPPNPSELLSSNRLKEILKQARSEYDIILIDSPPVLPVTDSSLIAPLADGVLMVYFAGKTFRSALARARNLLQNSDAKILGVVLNDVKSITGKSVYYYHTYFYGSKQA